MKARGKWFPARFCWLLWGEVHPAGRRCPRRRKIPEADGGGRAAKDPGLRRRRCRVGAGFESEGRHLVLLIADAQREVMQGAANDGIRAILKRWEQRYSRPASRTPWVRGRGHQAAAAVCGQQRCCV
jgi:hypothetical protein